MKEREYISARIDIISFDEVDIITSSGALGGENDDSPSWDNNGWT